MLYLLTVDNNSQRKRVIKMIIEYLDVIEILINELPATTTTEDY